MITMHGRVAKAAVISVALIIPVLVVLGGLALAGYPIPQVVASWVHGSLGGQMRIAQSLQESGPLLLTGLATAIAFSSGVLNIGAEGQYLIGAITMVAFSTGRCDLHRLDMPAALAVVLAVLIACTAAAAWALVASILQRWRLVPVVLSTLLLNFIAIFLVGALVEGPLHDPATSAPQTAEIDEGMRLPLLLPASGLHLGVLLAFVLAIVIWVLQRRTTLGYELRAIGFNPQAAVMAGMPVSRRQVLVMGLSGALAGLAGALQIAGVTHFMTTTTSSYGYAGMAVALLGRLHPLGVAASAVFFGMLDTGGRHLERDLGVPHDLGEVIKGLVVLAALVCTALPLTQRWMGARAHPPTPSAVNPDQQGV